MLLLMKKFSVNYIWLSSVFLHEWMDMLKLLKRQNVKKVKIRIKMLKFYFKCSETKLFHSFGLDQFVRNEKIVLT
jgi:hypothetical protein